MPSLVPITLTPQAIREAFADQLIACDVAGGNIVQTRPRPSAAEDAPVVNVFSPGSSGDGYKGQLPRFATSLQIVCAATVALAATSQEFEDVDKAIGDLVDAIELEIKTAILGDDVFAASFTHWSGIAVQKGTDTQGKAIRGTVNIEFTVVYQEQFELSNKSGPYDDLEQTEVIMEYGDDATILTRPIYRDRWVAHNGDNVVTHEPEQAVTHLSQGYDGPGT